VDGRASPARISIGRLAWLLARTQDSGVDVYLAGEPVCLSTCALRRPSGSLSRIYIRFNAIINRLYIGLAFNLSLKTRIKPFKNPVSRRDSEAHTYRSLQSRCTGGFPGMSARNKKIP
jgi:hypothetical protein